MYYVKITVFNEILFHVRNMELSYDEGNTELLKRVKKNLNTG